MSPLSVQFYDSSSGNPNTWFWDFGDGNTSFQQNPAHEYHSQGRYNVFLRVTNSLGQVDSLLRLSYISVATTLYADLLAELYYVYLPPRPGFWLEPLFCWYNLGTTAAENCVIKALPPSQMTIDTIVAYWVFCGTYSGYYFSGDTIIMPLGTIPPCRAIGRFGFPPGVTGALGILPDTVTPGTWVATEMWLKSSTPDWNYRNNYAELAEQVRSSWDPNDKLAFPEGVGSSHAIEPDQRLAYTIRFENKAEATADVIYLRVVDTLDQHLDWGTLAIGLSSHPNKCDYEFDPYAGVIVWYCDSIMLPPNVNPPEGEGYFTFSISPDSGLAEGTQIANSAWIRFDYNPWMRAPEEAPVIRTIHYFIRGDANDDGVINSADIVYLINYLFIGGPPPDPSWLGDANCDGVVSVADVVYLINYLFVGGPPPGC
jgi:PKD repeat protein